MSAKGVDVLIQQITNNIYQNSTQDIDGQILQVQLIDLVDSLNQSLYNNAIPYKAGQSIVFVDGAVKTSYLCITDTTPGESPTTTPAKWEVSSTTGGVSLSSIELTISDLKAVTGYSDSDEILVNANNSIYAYSSASTETPDDNAFVKPDDITLPAPGRWVKIKTFEDTANKRASFKVTPDDISFPTEKLVKDSLDLKYDKTGGLLTGDVTVGTVSSGKNISTVATLGSELAPSLSTGYWTLGDGWRYLTSPNRLEKYTTGTTDTYTNPSITVDIGALYKIEVVIASLYDFLNIELGGVTGMYRQSSPGTIICYIEAITTGQFKITASNLCTTVISSISIKKVTNGNITIGGNLTISGNIKNVDGTSIVNLNNKDSAVKVVENQAGPFPQLLLENRNTTSAVAQTQLGFSGYDGTKISIMGWVGITSYQWNSGHSLKNITYLENYGGDGVYLLASAANGKIAMYTGGYTSASYERLRITPTGEVGIGTVTPTRLLELGAGSTSRAPFALTSGPLATGGNIKAGNIEFLTDAFYGTITSGTARKTFAFLEDPTFKTKITAPYEVIDRAADAAFAQPNTSGSTISAGVRLRLSNTFYSSNVFDFGQDVQGMWLQGSQYNDQAVHTPILINPNGGNLSVNKGTNSEALDVVGNALISGTIKSTDADWMMGGTAGQNRIDYTSSAFEFRDADNSLADLNAATVTVDNLIIR